MPYTPWVYVAVGVVFAFLICWTVAEWRWTQGKRSAAASARAEASKKLKEASEADMLANAGCVQTLFRSVIVLVAAAVILAMLDGFPVSLVDVARRLLGRIF